MRSHLLAGFLAVLIPACIVGGGDISGVGDDQSGGGGQTGGGDTGGGDTGGGGGSGSGSGSGTQATPRIEASIDKATVSTELGKTENLTVTIQSMDNFAGNVTLTPSVLDGTTAVTGFTVTANPATVDLTAGQTATVQLAVKIPTNAGSLTPTIKLDMSSGSTTANVSSAFTIAKVLHLDIAAGTGTGIHSSLPNKNSPIRIKSGTQIIFHNSDTAQHVIHGDGGIPHENTSLGQANTDYKVTVTNDATFYCHDHEGSSSARPVLVE